MCLAVVRAESSKTITFGYPRERMLKNSGCKPLAIPRQAPYSRRPAMVNQSKALAEIKFLILMSGQGLRVGLALKSDEVLTGEPQPPGRLRRSSVSPAQFIY
jgi:hypothetical protein